MDDRPIGVFDSGLGGLTTVRELCRLLPEEDIVYFGDTGRVPYGSRSRETIVKYARQDVAFLRTFDLKTIVIACGTVSTTALDVLAEDWQGEVVPSRAFAEGGIHEAIMEYENNVFFDILAEDLARRDMEDASIDQNNYEELSSRIDAYIAEFEQHGTDNILVDSDQL